MESKQPKENKKFTLSKKNIQILVAVALGIIVLILYFSTFGSKKPEDTSDQTSYSKMVTQQLQNVLSKINGVSKVEVIITFRDNGSTVYAKDENVVIESKTENGKVFETQTDSSKIVFVGGKPLIEKELLPEVRGVVIVCKGGGNAITRLELIKATMKALDVKSDLIEVFESK